MLAVCLLVSPTACAGRKEYVPVPETIRVTVPDAYTRATPVPVIGGDTNGDLLRERNALADGLESCNADKAAIRKIMEGDAVGKDR